MYLGKSKISRVIHKFDRINLDCHFHHGHPHCDSLHMNIRLGWDDFESEPDKKSEAAMGPGEAMVQVDVLFP